MKKLVAVLFYFSFLASSARVHAQENQLVLVDGEGQEVARFLRSEDGATYALVLGWDTVSRRLVPIRSCKSDLASLTRILSVRMSEAELLALLTAPLLKEVKNFANGNISASMPYSVKEWNKRKLDRIQSLRGRIARIRSNYEQAVKLSGPPEPGTILYHTPRELCECEAELQSMEREQADLMCEIHSVNEEAHGALCSYHEGLGLLLAQTENGNIQLSTQAPWGLELAETLRGAVELDAKQGRKFVLGFTP